MPDPGVHRRQIHTIDARISEQETTMLPQDCRTRSETAISVSSTAEKPFAPARWLETLLGSARQSKKGAEVPDLTANSSSN